ncbi:MAG: 2OG-Fe(II) oxygenase [Aliishimia sp.]
MRDILDLDNFAIDQPGTDAYLALVARCRADLSAHGMFNLDDFLHACVAQDVAETLAPRFASDAFHHTRYHNIYFEDRVAGLPTDHPALRRFLTSNFTLCADQIEGTCLTQVYEYAPLRAFLADVMAKEALFMMDDPLARINVMRYGARDALNWHFDRSEFTVTLLLQQPQSGGAFQYRTDLRSPNDENHDGVTRLLSGDDPNVQSMSVQAGTLNVFQGINTPHRVTPVEGARDRVIAVFSYYEAPGIRFDPAQQIGFYGRSA